MPIYSLLKYAQLGVEFYFQSLELIAFSVNCENCDSEAVWWLNNLFYRPP